MNDRVCIRAFLERAWRRHALRQTAYGAALAVPVALLLLAAGRYGWLPWRVALVSGGAAIIAAALAGARGAWDARARIAHHVERRMPQCRNLLVTAAELGAWPPVAGAAMSTGKRALSMPDVKSEIVRLVEAHAAARVRQLDAATLFPLRRAVALLAGGLSLWAALATVAGAVPASTPRGVARGDAPGVTSPDATPAIGSITIALTPPAYTGRAADTAVDPAGLQVIAGTHLDVIVHASAESVRLTTLEGERDLDRLADGTFAGELVAEADGFLSFEPRSGARPGPRRLIGLVVAPDAPPRVRITEPGRDLFLPQAEGGVPLIASATDDFGLDALRFTYTIVSGSGETFEFTEGELPAELTRGDQLSWSARAELSPAALGLSLGDLVVYRAVARDRRPGAEDVVSDAFVLEIVGENAAIAGGFALESDEEREALSQRMVIIKTERLLAQQGSMSAEAYDVEARRIAAEQRLVRAEFVFMMGGEIQDEVEEAEHEHEVAAGRLELRGRVEMTRAVQLMSQAATMLTEADLEAALPLENAALEALQSALARSRYILRTISERESIDLARRLSGDPGAPRGARAANEVVADPELPGMRRILAELAGLVARATTGARTLSADDAQTIGRLAEEVLRLDPSSEELQEIAADLAQAAAADALAGAAERATPLLERAVDRLADRLDRRLPRAPAAPDTDPALAGALSDELQVLVPAGGGR
jgi:hypothetical protein